VADGKLALITEQMAFHHIAEGSARGKDWHFNNGSLYDALFVMQDAETKTLWNHITGEALYGPMVGRTLGPLGNVLQMMVKQALAMDPNVRIAISDRAYFINGRRMGRRCRPSQAVRIAEPEAAAVHFEQVLVARSA
jgi:hypothetical protein